MDAVGVGFGWFDVVTDNLFCTLFSLFSHYFHSYVCDHNLNNDPFSV